MGTNVHAADIGTAFTFQGRLVKDGTPVNSSPPHCNLTFGLWDAAAGGNQKGNSPQAASGVAVADDLFTFSLDFGAAGIDGAAGWLEITVQCPGNARPTTLLPRQELKPTPHALRAVEAAALDLPFAPTASTSAPMLELTQTGDGAAAIFKVQPQPEPSFPSPALKAISSTSAPAIVATNVSTGSGLEVARGTLMVSNAPTISATNIGVGTAAYVTAANGTAVHAVSADGLAGYFEGHVSSTSGVSCASLAWGTSALDDDQGGAIELGNSLTTGNNPYIDFHLCPDRQKIGSDALFSSAAAFSSRRCSERRRRGANADPTPRKQEEQTTSARENQT